MRTYFLYVIRSLLKPTIDIYFSRGIAHVFRLVFNTVNLKTEAETRYRCQTVGQVGVTKTYYMN